MQKIKLKSDRISLQTKRPSLSSMLCNFFLLMHIVQRLKLNSIKTDKTIFFNEILFKQYIYLKIRSFGSAGSVGLKVYLKLQDAGSVPGSEDLNFFALVGGVGTVGDGGRHRRIVFFGKKWVYPLIISFKKLGVPPNHQIFQRRPSGARSAPGGRSRFAPRAASAENFGD